jgi:hypothetical protein
MRLDYNGWRLYYDGRRRYIAPVMVWAVRTLAFLFVFAASLPFSLNFTTTFPILLFLLTAIIPLAFVSTSMPAFILIRVSGHGRYSGVIG